MPGERINRADDPRVDGRSCAVCRGAMVSRNALLADVWGYDEAPLTRTVDVHVAGLRQKIEPNPRIPEYIITVHGLGDKFAA